MHHPVASTLSAAFAAALSLVPAFGQSKPVESKPAQPKPAQSKPATGAEASAKPAETKKVYQLGDVIAPQTKLVDLDNKELRLGSLRGKVVVIDFWSIQCPVSVRYEERLKKLHAAYAGKDVVILAVNPNNREMDRRADDPAHKIRAYIKKAKVPYRVLIDRDHRLADALRATTTPHAFVLDRELRLVYEGGIDSDRQWYASNRGKQPEPWLRQAVDATLAGQPVENKSTKEWGCSIKRTRGAGGRRPGARRGRGARGRRPAAGSPPKKKAGRGVDR